MHRCGRTKHLNHLFVFLLLIFLLQTPREHDHLAEYGGGPREAADTGSIGKAFPNDPTPPDTSPHGPHTAS